MKFKHVLLICLFFISTAVGGFNTAQPSGRFWDSLYAGLIKIENCQSVSALGDSILLQVNGKIVRISKILFLKSLLPGGQVDGYSLQCHGDSSFYWGGGDTEIVQSINSSSFPCQYFQSAYPALQIKEIGGVDYVHYIDTVLGYIIPTGSNNKVDSAHYANNAKNADSVGHHAPGDFEPYISPGTTAQYLRGDMTWQPIAHNLLSMAHSDVTTAAVQRGDLITGQGSTTKWGRLPLGASGYFLKSNGTDAGWATHGLTYSDVGADASGAAAAAANAAVSGTAYYIAGFTGSHSVGNSNIYNSSSGKIGIGTTNPDSALSVNGAFHVAGNSKFDSPINLLSNPLCNWYGFLNSYDTMWYYSGYSMRNSRGEIHQASFIQQNCTGILQENTAGIDYYTPYTATPDSGSFTPQNTIRFFSGSGILGDGGVLCIATFNDASYKCMAGVGNLTIRDTSGNSYSFTYVLSAAKFGSEESIIPIATPEDNTIQTGNYYGAIPGEFSCLGKGGDSGTPSHGYAKILLTNHKGKPVLCNWQFWLTNGY